MNMVVLYYLPKWLNLFLDIFILTSLLEYIYGNKKACHHWVKYTYLSLLVVFLFDNTFNVIAAPYVFTYLIVFAFICISYSLLLKGYMFYKVLTSILICSIFAQMNAFSMNIFRFFPSHLDSMLWYYFFVAKALDVLVVLVILKCPINQSFSLPTSFKAFMISALSIVIMFRLTSAKANYILVFQYSFIFDLLIYLVCYLITQEYGKKLQFQVSACRLSLQLEGWGDIEKAYNELRKLRHDMKNHMTYMQSLLEKGEYSKLNQYIEDVGNKHMLSKVIVHSGFPVIDAVLTAKGTRCTMLDIPIDVQVLLPCELRMDDDDLCCVLSNLLDNAIEASKSEDSPHIKTTIHENKGLLIINVSNKSKENILLINPDLATTKINDTQHGLGIRIVKDIVGRYSGWLSFNHIDGYMVAKVNIPNKTTLKYSEDSVINSAV